LLIQVDNQALNISNFKNHSIKLKTMTTKTVKLIVFITF